MDKIVVCFIYRNSKTNECTDDIVTFDFIKCYTREKAMSVAFKLGNRLCKLKGYDNCEWAYFSACEEIELMDELKSARNWLNSLWDAYYYFRKPVPSWFTPSDPFDLCDEM